tara:strand:- start:259 stop:1026 length:768 start_codon:yes stop_codon:yes gene_type:complete
MQAGKYGKDLNKKSFSSKYWEKYFDKRATNSLLFQSHSINGFIDKKLVFLIRKTIRNILKSKGFENIFDCGCGDGSVSFTLINSNTKVYGIDISKQMCIKARSKGIKAFKFDMYKLTKKSFEDLKIVKNPNDKQNSCLLFCESLTCTRNPINILKGVCKRNKEINSVLLSFPNEKSILRKIIKLVSNNKLNYFGLEKLNIATTKLSFYKKDSYYILGIPFLYYFAIRIKENESNKLTQKLLSFLGLNLIILYQKS